MKLAIPLKILREILSKCLGSSNERIFVGVGIDKDRMYAVEEVFECDNISSTPEIRFLADPLCIYKVFRYAEDRGMDIVVLAHCHPALPNPSYEDLRGMKLWRIPWLIVDSVRGGYKAWILDDDKLSEILIEELNSET